MNLTVVHSTGREPHAAHDVRRALDVIGVSCVSVLGAPGSGKSALLAATLPRVRAGAQVGVLVGDTTGTADLEPFAALDVPVVQVLTSGPCHLTAADVCAGLAELPLGELDYVFIEASGTPGCLATQDLGEHLRMVVTSATGGIHGVRRHTPLLRDARLAVLSQSDLAAPCGSSVEALTDGLRSANPRAEVVATDVRRRVGIDRLAGWLLGYSRAQVRAANPGVLAGV